MSEVESERSERPLVLVKGDATAEEVAALVAVVQAVAAASAAAAAGSAAPRRTSAWAAPHRRLRQALPHGPGAWKASALPR